MSGWATQRVFTLDGSLRAAIAAAVAHQGEIDARRASARDAVLVKSDSETTTQADINLGILNILIGFAPVRPAEFVVLRIQQRLQTNA